MCVLSEQPVTGVMHTTRLSRSSWRGCFLTSSAHGFHSPAPAHFQFFSSAPIGLELGVGHGVWRKEEGRGIDFREDQGDAQTDTDRFFCESAKGWRRSSQTDGGVLASSDVKIAFEVARPEVVADICQGRRRGASTVGRAEQQGGPECGAPWPHSRCRSSTLLRR